MKDRDLVRLSDDSADLLACIAVHVQTLDLAGKTVLDRMRDGQNGQPQAARYDRSSQAAPVIDGDWPNGENPIRDSHLPSDPTGEAAIRVDKAAQDRRDLERALGRIQREATAVTSILARWTPRHPTDADKAKVEKDNTPSCQSCSRITGHHGQPFFSPVFRHGTVKGNLEEALHLCSWCYKFVGDTGRMPQPKELEQHRDGIPVRRSA